MNRLDPKACARLGQIAAEVDKLYDEMDQVLEQAKSEIGALREIADAKRAEAYGLLEDAHRAADEFFDARSDKWQEGEKGQAYGEWRDKLASLRDEMDELPDNDLPGIERPTFIERLNSEEYDAPEEV